MRREYAGGVGVTSLVTNQPVTELVTFLAWSTTTISSCQYFHNDLSRLGYSPQMSLDAFEKQLSRKLSVLLKFNMCLLCYGRDRGRLTWLCIYNVRAQTFPVMVWRGCDSTCGVLLVMHCQQHSLPSSDYSSNARYRKVRSNFYLK